jgi:hypothetical protein
MKASFASLLVLIPLALAVAVVPAAGLDGLTSPPTCELPATAPGQQTAKLPDLRHSAIGVVIEANGGRVPATGVELHTALQKLGNFVELSFPFSAVALDSGLSHPRVVLTQRPTPSHEVIPFTPSGGWGGGSSPGAPQIVSTPIPTLPANQPNLEGRLFLAANMEPGPDGTNARVKTVEFISWNSRRLKFDFGVIEDMGGTPQLKLLDGTRCFSCHKNRGPILGVGPWSNSIHNDVVRAASAQLLTFDEVEPSQIDGIPVLLPTPDRIDGMALLVSSGPEVEEAVRAGAGFLRDREVFRALTKTPEGRKVFLMLLVAIVEPEPLDTIDKSLRRDLNKVNLIRFMTDAVAIRKATPSSFLADFSPSGSVGRVTGNRVAWGGSVKSVALYDADRAAGKVGLPPQHLPSNPKAFLTPPANTSANPSDHASAMKLARTLGLTEGDRKFLADRLDRVATLVNKPAVTPASLAREVFTGPAFADIMTGDALPDRDEFKDRFVTGLTDAARSYNYWIWTDRRDYAGTPEVDRSAVEKEVEVVPTTACLRCHDTRTAGKRPAFSPIPVLAFDPFDKTAREAWLKTADRKQRLEVLGRFLTRLGKDKDMPPEDSTEAELFRGQNPAAFAAVTDWLEAELKKAKGR